MAIIATGTSRMTIQAAPNGVMLEEKWVLRMTIAAAKQPSSSRQGRAAATASPPPSCRRRRAFALPPPPQLPHCCHRAAAVALCAAAAKLPSTSRCCAAALPRCRSLVGCCIVVRHLILSSHAVMRPSTLSLPAAFADKLSSTATAAAAGPPQLPPPPPWSNSPSYIGEEREILLVDKAGTKTCYYSSGGALVARTLCDGWLLHSMLSRRSSEHHQ